MRLTVQARNGKIGSLRAGAWQHRLQRFVAALCVTSLLISSGWYAVALQIYGWARMFDAYHASMPAAEAINIALSGEELCGICVLSEEARKDLDETIKKGIAEMQSLLLEPATNAVMLRPPMPKSFAFFAAKPVFPLEISRDIEPPPPRRA